MTCARRSRDASCWRTTAPASFRTKSKRFARTVCGCWIRGLVRDRIAAAVAQGSLSPSFRAHAERSNVYAAVNIAGRESQICFVLGRSTFDEDAGGCFPLVAHWGGEAMRGGPNDAPLLAGSGTPSIVLTRLNLTTPWRHSTTHPALAKMFVGTLPRHGASLGRRVLPRSRAA